jgi:DNA-binding NarL/FixJ family response regulator
MVTTRISVVLIDDNLVACEGIVALIRSQPGLQVLAASANMEDALRQVLETRPDLVLLNLRREGEDGLTMAGLVHGQAPASRVIVMGLRPAREDVASLIRAGVSGFIMANAPFGVFLDTIHLVAEGTQVLPDELTASLFGQLHGPRNRYRTKRMLDVLRLTARERAVSDLIVQGLSNKEISVRLEITLHTVKSHVHRLLSKLEVNSRLEVAAFALSVPATAAAPA